MVGAAFFLETGKRLRRRAERDHTHSAMATPRRSITKANGS
jgi:hypothetical protein